MPSRPFPINLAFRSHLTLTWQIKTSTAQCEFRTLPNIQANPPSSSSPSQERKKCKKLLESNKVGEALCTWPLAWLRIFKNIRKRYRKRMEWTVIVNLSIYKIRVRRVFIIKIPPDSIKCSSQNKPRTIKISRLNMQSTPTSIITNDRVLSQFRDTEMILSWSKMVQKRKQMQQQSNN